MINMTFIGQSAWNIRRNLEHLEGTLGMNHPKLVDIAFKIYHAQETRILK